MAAQKQLANLSPDKIKKNPENPRVIFRENELDSLMRSIQEVGIQVPLSVYKKKNTEIYILIDGERRWRCASKLGLVTVPVIVEPEPTPLNNILMMFNIHNVRVQWDLIALAYKLERVKELVLKEKSVELSKKDLADLTGVTTATIQRCEDLLTLPKKYQDIIVNELKKPRGEQKYTEDLFLEIKKSIKTVDKYLPEITKKYTPNKLLDTFYIKYKESVVVNRVRFRDISKIARGKIVGIPKLKIIKSITRFIEEPGYTIEKAYEETVADAYSERTNEKKIQDSIDFLKNMEAEDVDNVLERLLLDLKIEISRLIKR